MSNQNGTCTHIKVTGVRCGSPALKGEQFCYFHQNAHRTVRRPKQSRLHPIALIEDEESIQYALMEVINALMKNTIDLKRATLILRALHIAVKNASRVKFANMGKSAVQQIPEYAPPPIEEDFDETSQIDLPYNAWVPPKTERQIMEEKARVQKLQQWRAEQAAIRENLERAGATLRPEAKPKPTQSVGADPLVRPASAASVSPVHAADEAKEEVVAPGTTAPHNVGTAALACPERSRRGCPGREATAPAPATISSVTPSPTASKATPPAATSVPPHNFKRTSPSATRTTLNHANPSARKPPKGATQAPKERKNSAHAARHG